MAGVLVLIDELFLLAVHRGDRLALRLKLFDAFTDVLELGVAFLALAGDPSPSRVLRLDCRL